MPKNIEKVKNCKKRRWNHYFINFKIMLNAGNAIQPISYHISILSFFSKDFIPEEQSSHLDTVCKFTMWYNTSAM